MNKNELADFLEKWVSEVEQEIVEQFHALDFDDVYNVEPEEYMYQSGYSNGILYACKQMRDKLND